MKPLVPSTMERWFTPSFRGRRQRRKSPSLIANTPVAGYVRLRPGDHEAQHHRRLKEIKLPVLAIAGEADLPAPGTRHIGETVPGAKLVMIPQAAHILERRAGRDVQSGALGEFPLRPCQRLTFLARRRGRGSGDVCATSSSSVLGAQYAGIGA